MSRGPHPKSRYMVLRTDRDPRFPYEILIVQKPGNWRTFPGVSGMHSESGSTSTNSTSKPVSSRRETPSTQRKNDATLANPLDPDQVDLQLRVLRAIWVLVSVKVRDDVGGQVAELGERLQGARDVEDWQTCRDLLAEIRQWLSTMAGGDGTDDVGVRILMSPPRRRASP